MNVPKYTDYHIFEITVVPVCSEQTCISYNVFIAGRERGGSIHTYPCQLVCLTV